MDATRDISSRVWLVAFILLSIALILPLWLITYPPGVDLPQHAAQVAIAKDWSDANLPYQEIYEFNPLSQSLLSHSLVFAFATLFSIVTALKIVVSIALLGIPLACLALIRAVRGDRWWVFAAFPISYSYAFYWGFLDFSVAVPLGLLLIAGVLAYVRQPSRRRLLFISLFPILVFSGHVLVLAYAGLASFVVLLLGSKGRERLVGLTGLCIVVPLVGAWFVAVQMAAPSSVTIPTKYAYTLSRVTDFSNYIVGIPGSLTYTAFGVLAVASPFLAGARPRRFGWQWSVLILAALFYFLVPSSIMGTGLLFPRYSIFIVPALFLALTPGTAIGSNGRVGRGLIVGLAVVSTLSTTFRFLDYEREASSFEPIVSEVEPGARILGLTLGPGSDAIPYPVFLHWASWIQVERKAVADFSFAEFFPNQFRYKADRHLPDHIEWAPFRFRWTKHRGADYDYFLLRHAPYFRFDPFRGADTEFEIVVESKPWALVRQRRADPKTE